MHVSASRDTVSLILFFLIPHIHALLPQSFYQLLCPDLELEGSGEINLTNLNLSLWL